MTLVIHTPDGRWLRWSTTLEQPAGWLSRDEALACLSSATARLPGAAGEKPLRDAARQMIAQLDDRGHTAWLDALERYERRHGAHAAAVLARRCELDVGQAKVLAAQREEDRKWLEKLTGPLRPAEVSPGIPKVRPRRAVREVEVIPQPKRWTLQDAREWHTLSDAARIANVTGGPTSKAIQWRAQSRDPQWAHYECVPSKDIPGDWHHQATVVYRLTQDTWESLDASLPSWQDEIEPGQWGTAAQVAAAHGISAAALHHRASSDKPQWACYERTSAKKIPGRWGLATTLYRITEPDEDSPALECGEDWHLVGELAEEHGIEEQAVRYRARSTSKQWARWEQISAHRVEGEWGTARRLYRVREEICDADA